jgi:hypothetical protein
MVRDDVADLDHQGRTAVFDANSGHHWNDSEVLNEQLRTIILERGKPARAVEGNGGWQSTDDRRLSRAAGGEVVQRVMAQ